MALTDNLVAYYKLDGNSNDSVGSNNGTDTNITYSTDYGKINQGARFQGNGYIQLATGSTFDLSGTALGISCWVKVDTLTDSCYILSIPSSSSYTFWGWAGFRFNSNGKMHFAWYNTNGNWKEYTSPTNPDIMNDGKKHHIVLSYDGSNVKIYIDNSLFWTQAVTGTISFNSTVKLTIGARWENSYSNFYKGGVDEMCIRNDYFTTDEIAQLYNDGEGLQYPFPTFNPHFSRRKLL